MGWSWIHLLPIYIVYSIGHRPKHWHNTDDFLKWMLLISPHLPSYSTFPGAILALPTFSYSIIESLSISLQRKGYVKGLESHYLDILGTYFHLPQSDLDLQAIIVVFQALKPCCIQIIWEALHVEKLNIISGDCSSYQRCMALRCKLTRMMACSAKTSSRYPFTKQWAPYDSEK